MHHVCITYSAGVSFGPSHLVVCPPAPDIISLHVGLPSSQSLILQHFCTGPRLFPILSLHCELSSHSSPSSSMWSSSPSWPLFPSFLEYVSGLLLLVIPSFYAFFRRHSSSELLDRLNVLQLPLRPCVLPLADLCFITSHRSNAHGVTVPCHKISPLETCAPKLRAFGSIAKSNCFLTSLSAPPCRPLSSPTLPMCKHLPNGCRGSAK